MGINEMVKRKLTSSPVDTKMPPVKKLKLSTQCSVSCKRKAFLAGKAQWRLQLHCHSFLKGDRIMVLIPVNRSRSFS